MIYYILL